MEMRAMLSASRLPAALPCNDMIRQIRQLLSERKRMSLKDLGIHFDAEPETLEPMLDALVRRGTIRRIEPDCERKCSGCAGCPDTDPADLVFYEMY